MKAALPNPSLPYPIAYEAVVEMCELEGFSLTAYKCPAGVWTCGWGETDGVTPSTRWSKEYCEQRLLKSLQWRVEKVREMCAADTNDNQLSALVMLAYNIGLRDDKAKRGLYHTTVLRQHNAGNFEAAARAFGLLNKFRDPVTKQLVVARGLTRRRALEAALYLKPVAKGVEMPQSVEPESTMAASPISQGSGAVGAIGVALMAYGAKDTEVGAVAAPVATAIDGASAWLGVPPLVAIASALLFVGVAIWYWRKKQREDGWC